MRRRLALLLAFLPFTAAFGGAAPAPPAPVHETADVSLVDVPVNVIGHDGKPVRNLKAADFSLEDDGKRQPILSVDTFDLSSVHGIGAPDQSVPAGGRRHFLLLFRLLVRDTTGNCPFARGGAEVRRFGHGAGGSCRPSRRFPWKRERVFCSISPRTVGSLPSS